MASIKVKFRPSTVDGREGVVYYQVVHERKIRQLNTHYRIFPAEWDEQRSMVSTRNSKRPTTVTAIIGLIHKDMERLTRIIQRMGSQRFHYTADDIIEAFHHHTRENTFMNFMQSIIGKLKNNGKIRTSETYTATLNSFKKFLHTSVSSIELTIGEDIMLDSVTSDLMEAYEAWLKQQGLIPNSISFYTRILRAVYNRAVELDIIENRNPFRRVYTGVDKTIKRALPITFIKRIKGLNLSLDPALDYARDMFLLSFMLRGMSFIDMAFLKKSDRNMGMVTYRRRKTGQKLIIAWTKDMQMILDKYPENKSDYLLPIIKKTGINERATYRNAASSINRNLKKVGEIAGLDVPLTLYVARHSWASAAQSKGIPISVISEGMWHDSESTTRIYLASLDDTSMVDKANSIILKSL